MAIRAIARQNDQPDVPVMFMLDEMGTIGSLTMVEQAFGLMAGIGVRIWAFLQDLPQLKRDYPASWETFISNSSVIQG
jgi:type IV secretion system protein VirD4